MKVAMLLLAAGRGRRLGSAVPKAWLPCAGRPLALHAAARLAEVAATDTLDATTVLVVDPADRREYVAPLERQLRSLGVEAIVDGGRTRQESMAAGLAALDREGPADTALVLVHDAARPLLPVAATREALAAAGRVGAALLAIPASDTVKEVGDRAEVLRTLDRGRLWLAQTPQVIRRDLLARAIVRAAADGFEATDDVSLVEHLGEPVAVVQGSPHNLKVTRPEDLELAAFLLGRTGP